MNSALRDSTNKHRVLTSYVSGSNSFNNNPLAVPRAGINKTAAQTQEHRKKKRTKWDRQQQDWKANRSCSPECQSETNSTLTTTSRLAYVSNPQLGVTTGRTFRYSSPSNPLESGSGRLGSDSNTRVGFVL